MKKIIVKNFRGIEELSLDLDKLNIITAPNGSGKSSFIDAIHWMITGNVNDDDIRHGTEIASVEIHFETGNVLKRTRVLKQGASYANDKKVTDKVLEEMLSNELNCSLETAKAVCGTDFLDGLSTKDLTAFLLKILPITVKSESLNGLIEEYLGRKLLPDEEAFLKTQLNKDVYTLDDFTEVYNNCFAQRRVRKKDLEEVKTKAKFDTTTLPQESKESLQKSLTEISLKEKSINEYDDKLKAFNKANEDFQKVANRKKEIEEELLKYKDVEKPTEDLEKIKAEKKQFMDVIEKKTSEYALSQSELKSMVDAYNNLENPVCPLTKAKCTADLTQYKDKVGEQGKELAKKAKEIKEYLIKCREQVEKKDKRIEDYNNQYLLWNKKDGLTKELGNLVFPTIPEKPVEVKAEDLSNEKAAIELKLAIYASYEASQQYSKQAISVGREVELLDLCVKLFDTKGIKNCLLKRGLVRVEEIINRCASAIRPDFKITLLGKDGLDVNIYPDGVTPVPINKVSSGEFILTAYLIMGAIHDITNVSFFVIDDMDRLDKDNAIGFMNLIKVDGRFKNVILAGVNHEDFTNAIPSDANVTKL